MLRIAGFSEKPRAVEPEHLIKESRGFPSKEPRPSGRGFSEEVQLLNAVSFRLMKPNVLLDHLRRHLIPHRPDEIAIFPKLPTPQLLAHLRIFPPNLLRTDRLEQPSTFPIEYLGGKLRNRCT